MYLKTFWLLQPTCWDESLWVVMCENLYGKMDVPIPNQTMLWNLSVTAIRLSCLMIICYEALDGSFKASQMDLYILARSLQVIDRDPFHKDHRFMWLQCLHKKHAIFIDLYYFKAWYRKIQALNINKTCIWCIPIRGKYKIWNRLYGKAKELKGTRFLLSKTLVDACWR